MSDDTIFDPATLNQTSETNGNLESNSIWEETNTSTWQDFQETINILQDQLARAQSDYSNLVRRSREESMQIGQWTEDKTILKFLPILDNLERALDHVPTELVDNTWVEGISSIVHSMQKIISDFGITPMITTGEEVDPDLHDVVSQIPHPTMTIQADIEKGYIRWERTIRHAKVIVWDGQITSQ